MAVRAIALALALSGCGWGAQQKSFAAATTALLAVDWHQTHGIVDRCGEINPVIGPCGERLPVNFYFPVVTMGVIVIANLLPEQRDALLGVVAGAEGATIWNNFMVGR